ncbi:hypothetical protein C0J52_17068 [Blattella germanica]|nr:hypothetical protein C0J52_17068 [Blattella germanica]
MTMRLLRSVLSVQMVVLMDQIGHKNAIPITDGIKFVEKPNSQGRSLSDNEVLTEESLETSLPRSLGDRQSVLDGLMLNKMSSFLDSFTMNVNLPDARALRRGGLKMKKMLLPFLMGVVLKTASIVPVILSIMAVLAVKALLLSKGALILTGLLGFRKLFHNGHHGAQQKHHLLQHDLGLSSIGHGIANFMHHMGGGYDHHYAHPQSVESHGAASVGADAMYGRSFNSLPFDDILKTSAIKKSAVSQRFVTELPRMLQN